MWGDLYGWLTSRKPITTPVVSERALSASPQNQLKGKLFWNSVLTGPEPLDRGEVVHRISGHFQFRNFRGEIVNVGYIGTTHEYESMIAPTIPLPGASASAEELAFALRQFESLRWLRAPKVFIEQGSSSTLNSTHQSLSITVPSLGDSIRPIDALLRTEMWKLAEHLLHEGNAVENVSVAFNPASLRFLVGALGPEVTVRFMLDRLMQFGISGESASRAIEQMARDHGLWKSLERSFQRVTLEFASRFAEPEYLAVSRRLVPDYLKDRYSADRIYHQTENVIVLAHTAHILGIVYYLLPYITELDPAHREVAQIQLGAERSFQKSWGPAKCSQLIPLQNRRSRYYLR